MSDVYIVAYDGSDTSKRAAACAGRCARLSKAKLHVVHILEWSPYSFLTPEELEERHQRRQSELERATVSVLDPFLAELKLEGHEVSGEVRYGQPAKLLNEVAEEQKASMIFAAKSGENTLSSRVLGTVSAALVNTAIVPVTIVP